MKSRLGCASFFAPATFPRQPPTLLAWLSEIQLQKARGCLTMASSVLRSRLCRVHPSHLLVNENKIHYLKKSVARRLFSSSEKEDLIPEPTWSLQDLELSSSTGEPVSMQELERLARKSLLDVSKLKDTDALRRDLANMLHCLEQVREVNLPNLSDEDVYDVPRGVTAAPLRSATTDAFAEEEEKEAKQVFESLLKPKTMQRGAHAYFSVVTKREVVPK